jgi:hypothetical protein
VLCRAGDAWEIERCNCEWSSQVGCDALGGDHLLWGYAEYREAGGGYHVPIAPAQCCKACVGDQLHRMDVCRALNYCSHHGVCVRSCSTSPAAQPYITAPTRRALAVPLAVPQRANATCGENVLRR